jgi:Flp pilus assembly protein TadG
MKDKKGQALIEFVILLPVLIILLFIVIDFGRVFYEKNKLENISTDVVNMYKENGNIDESLFDESNIKIVKSNKYVEIVITKEIDLLTPALDKTGIGNLETKRIIYNE